MDFIKPKRIPEANIQAEVYRLCREYGIKVCLEYTYEHSRFDMVIVKDDKIILIVEFKSSPKEDRANRWYKSKQCFKYQKYGVPILCCTNWDSIEDTFNKIKEIYFS